MEEDHPVDGPLRPTVAALALSASKVRDTSCAFLPAILSLNGMRSQGERRIGMAILQARRRRDASDRVHTSFLAASFVDNSQVRFCFPCVRLLNSIFIGAAVLQP